MAHMARANPHWHTFAGAEGGAERLVVFPGPHAYVSPRWYASPTAVPTWNYVAVHVYGTPRVVDDPDAVRAAQRKLVERYEDGAAPWSMEDADAGFIDGMLRGIVSGS